MRNQSSTYRLAAALLAVVFGLAWSAPVVQAVCVPAGPGSSSHCGTSESAEHCERAQGAVSAGWAAHRANQELRTTTDVEPSPAGEEGTGSVRLAQTASTTSIPLSRRAVHRAVRRHAHVGVWLE